MSTYERRAWIMLVTSVPAFFTYLVIVLNRAEGIALTDVDYRWPALIVIGGAIVLNIVLEILGSIVWRGDGTLVDERDRSIDRLGERVGASFIILGGLGAMLMAMFECSGFWIANTLFTAFFIAGVLSSITKIAAYRWGVAA